MVTQVYQVDEAEKVLLVNQAKMARQVKFLAVVQTTIVNSLVCPVLLVLRVQLAELARTVPEVSKVLMVPLVPQVETVTKL
jgi:hypothetical protein